MSKKNIYYLCFECENDYGKKEVYPFLTAPLQYIDMYTCFCSNQDDLFEKLVYNKDKTALTKVGEFITSNFKVEKKKYSFYIRKVLAEKKEDATVKNVEKARKKGTKETELSILYSDNRDVVYINNGENKNELLDILVSLKMSVSECNVAQMCSIDTEEYQKCKIKKTFFWKIIKKLEKRNKKLLDLFDSSVHYSLDRATTLATNINNLILLEEETKKDVILRRELALDIKDVLIKLDDLDHTKTRMISKEESLRRQEKREENTEFRYSIILKTIGKFLKVEQEYYDGKYGVDEPKTVRKEDELGVRIEELNSELLVAEEEIIRIEEKIKTASKSEMPGLQKQLDDAKKTRDSIRNKIDEAEYTSEELRKGNFIFSDAGFIIDQKSKKI